MILLQLLFLLGLFIGLITGIILFYIIFHEDMKAVKEFNKRQERYRRMI